MTDPGFADEIGRKVVNGIVILVLLAAVSGAALGTALTWWLNH